LSVKLNGSQAQQAAAWRSSRGVDQRFRQKFCGVPDVEKKVKLLAMAPTTSSD
jgi:hypothetical protein